MLERAIQGFCGNSEKVHLEGSSRTDVGVHALGNTAHFDFSKFDKKTGKPVRIFFFFFSSFFSSSSPLSFSYLFKITHQTFFLLKKKVDAPSEESVMNGVNWWLDKTNFQKSLKVVRVEKKEKLFHCRRNAKARKLKHFTFHYSLSFIFSHFLIPTYLSYFPFPYSYLTFIFHICLFPLIFHIFHFLIPT